MGKTETPLISVGLVTYNRADLLRRAIDSVLKQTFSNYELIISDDNSSDGTEGVVKQYLGMPELLMSEGPVLA